MRDGFINISFDLENLDRFYIRKSILKSIKNNLPLFKGELLDIGCGKMPYKEFIQQNSLIEKYVGLDIESAKIYDVNIKPDFTWDGITMPFENNLFETAYATEVLEHCPKPEIVMSEVNRILKPGGIFFFTVPFLWPLHEVPHDEFRYTPFSLKRLLEESGFVNVDIKATGGWNASMAQMLGLWVRRAPMTDRRRKFLARFLKPVIQYLIKIDCFSEVEFKEGQMITGIYGIAYKK